MNQITFTKVREVKSPSQAYEYPAGMDLHIPEYNQEFYNDFLLKNEKDQFELSISPNCDSMTITIMPNSRVLIPSGIKVELENKNSCLVAANKSGIASKKGLIFGAQVVDADYKGEIHINLINTNNYPVSIKTGDKVIQFLNLPIIYPSLVEVSNSEYEAIASYSNRGANGFGSSGN